MVDDQLLTACRRFPSVRATTLRSREQRGLTHLPTVVIVAA